MNLYESRTLSPLKLKTFLVKTRYFNELNKAIMSVTCTYGKSRHGLFAYTVCSNETDIGTMSNPVCETSRCRLIHFCHSFSCHWFLFFYLFTLFTPTFRQTFLG